MSRNGGGGAPHHGAAGGDGRPAKQMGGVLRFELFQEPLGRTVRHTVSNTQRAMEGGPASGSSSHRCG
eukprot:1512965-Pyramimonas_sp.AAC.1